MSKKIDYEFKNLSEADQACLSVIESLGIYELRALARVFGDNSPTVLKRSDHIKFVMNKILSGEDLKPLPLRPGRPYKELSNIEGILRQLSQITGKNYSLTPNIDSRAKKVVSFNQIEDEIYLKKSCPIEVQGIVCESEDQYVLSDQNSGKFILIPKSLDEKIRPYDFVVGQAILMNNKGEYILDKITSINFQERKNFDAKADPYIETIPSESFEIENKKILLGSRYLLKVTKFSEKAEKMKKLLKTFSTKKIITLAITPDVFPEDMVATNSLGFSNVFMSKYDDSPYATYEMFNTFVNHVKHLQEQGLKIAVFVENITSIANSIDYVNKNSIKSFMGHTENAVNMIKQLVSLAKAGEGNKHTTLITSLDESDMFDQLYVKSVYKVSKLIEL